MRPLAFLAAVLALPLVADEPKKDQVGVDHVTVYNCPCLKEFWTQSADDARDCPFEYCNEHPNCGDLDGEYKIVVTAARDSVRAGKEVAFDVEVYELVVDKDAKPDEVRVKDVATIRAKFTPGEEKEGEFVPGAAGEVVTAVISGKDKTGVVKQTLAKKGECVLSIEVVRGNKTKSKIEAEIQFTVE